MISASHISNKTFLPHIPSQEGELSHKGLEVLRWCIYTFSESIFQKIFYVLSSTCLNKLLLYCNFQFWRPLNICKRTNIKKKKNKNIFSIKYISQNALVKQIYEMTLALKLFFRKRTIRSQLLYKAWDTANKFVSTNWITQRKIHRGNVFSLGQKG